MTDETTIAKLRAELRITTDKLLEVAEHIRVLLSTTEPAKRK
jgi:hypothetical protein